MCKVNFKHISLIILVIMGFNSCKKDFEDLALEDWNPVLAVPLIYSELSVDDLISDLNHPEEILIYPDDLVALNYKGKLVSFESEQIMSIGDVNENATIEINESEATLIDEGIDPVPINVTFPIIMNFEPEDMSISEILFSAGLMNIQLTRLQDEWITGELVINELTDSMGQPFVLNISGDQPVGTAEQALINLEGYRLHTVSGISDHEFYLDFALTLTNNTSNMAISGSFIEVSFSVNDLAFEHIIGSFGTLDVSTDTDSIQINLFSNVQGGEFALEEAILNLDISNSLGFPIEIDMGETVSINQNTGNQVQLVLDDINLQGQESLNAPPEVQFVTYNNQNANITTLFDSAPDLVIFAIDATSNPNGPPPPSNLNFITDESKFVIDIDLILPLEGYVLDLLITDSIAVDFSFDEYDVIDSIEFKLHTENGFPLGIDFQSFFIDENHLVIDSLFTDDSTILPPAQTDNNGDVINSSEYLEYILLGNERANNLERTRQIYLQALFNTSGSELQEIIRIKNNQYMTVELGMKIYGHLDL